jgi:type IV secretory pathway VirB2 component (pilin)
METFEQVRSFVEQHRGELESAAGTPEFSRELDNLRRVWAEEEDPAQNLEDTLRVLRKYPAVWSRLELAGVVAPAVPPSPVPSTTPSPAPVAPPVKAVQPPPAPRTPIDTKLAFIREVVTGSIGILIVVVSLFCTVVALFRGGDMFPFLSGLVGVVLGYYFGRAPGEAQAAKAQVEVQGARKELDQMTSEVRSVLDSNTGATARSAGGVVMDAAQVERLRRLAGTRYAM